MAETTHISWADATANFWMGCTKVSAACDHCYAERDWDHRFAKVTWGPHGARKKVAAGAQVMRKMQRGAEAFIAQHGRKPRVFINSLSDVFDNHKRIDPAWREEIWQAARDCPDVILMLLTKRPQNIAKMLPDDWSAEKYPNVWLGATVENQEEANRRLPHLLSVDAALHFASYEPALGPVDWRRVGLGNGVMLDALTGYHFARFSAETHDVSLPKPRHGLGLIIAGGESGPKARPSHPDWFRSTRDQCADSFSTVFHFKQWGEWSSEAFAFKDCWKGAVVVDLDGRYRAAEDALPSPNSAMMARIGKTRAGNILDGRQHLDMPGGA